MVKHATHFGRGFMNVMYNKNSVFSIFFGGEFSPPSNKKKGLANPSKGFLRIFLKIAISREKKN
jgi:hypothetical protein